MSSRRRTADGPFLLLGAVAAVFLGSLLLFVGSHTLPYDPLVECRTTVATVVARLTTVGVMLPLGVVAIVLLTGVIALGHQLWATRRMLLAVLDLRVPESDRLSRLAGLAGLDELLDVVDDDAAFTFCHGLIRPRVCLSTGMAAVLDDDELLAVMRHEAHHVQHRDPIKILISRTVSSGLMFLPLAGALHESFLAGKEICADSDATEASGHLPLASALVKLLAADKPVWPAGVLAIGAFSPTEARLRRLLGADGPMELMPSAVDWIVSLALVAGIFGFSYGSAAAGHVPPVNTACAPQVSVTTPAVQDAAAPSGAVAVDAARGIAPTDAPASAAVPGAVPDADSELLLRQDGGGWVVP